MRRRELVLERGGVAMDRELVPPELLVVGATTLALFSATALLLAAIAI
jgi:hypothetical protein